MALTWLEVCGFRSYVNPQRFEFDGVFSVVDGANSQGKTSTAEAIEFLLTGTTVRRQLLGGAKAEFADSLRNAHIASNAPVRVRAGLVGPDGAEHIVERVLETDYTAENECTSRLTIDGTIADDLSSIGIVLADPPLRAPVLLQHSLRFALSARPQDRADYFKSVLEVQDLETLRDLIKSGVDALPAPASELVTNLRALAGVSELASALADAEAKAMTRADVESTLAEAVDAALASVGVKTLASDHLCDKVEKLTRALEAACEGDFPVPAYEVGAPPKVPDEQDFAALCTYNEAAEATDAETQRLRKLFEVVLALPALTDLGEGSLDCPVCETPEALTPERIATLRRRVAADSGLSVARSRAEAKLTALGSELSGLRTAVARCVPGVAELDRKGLDEHAELVQQLIGDAASHSEVHADLSTLKEAAQAVSDAADKLDAQIEEAKQALSDAQCVDLDILAATSMAVRTPVEELVAARIKYVNSSSAFIETIRAEVERRRGTVRWRQLAELASDATTLHDALVDQRAYARVRREAEHAVASIDQAKAKVFDEKFTAMSGDIGTWWNLLRPDEPARFASVRRRGMGKRFVSFKAHLYAADGVPAVERDALGVFSDSQLNALSLAAFLARCRLQGAPFVVLDDPLQAGDDEHRPTFGDYVLGKLLEEGVQVIVFTHDDRTSKLIHHLYERLPVVGFALALEKPIEGTSVTRTSNTAEALLQRAKVYLDSDDPQLRGSAASKLREAAERIAKEIIVKSRNANNDSCSLTDYDGITLGPLIRDITPYLTHSDEPGKWRVIGDWLNPGAHDDTPPAKNELKMAFGYLSEFVKTYLRARRVTIAARSDS